MALQWSNWPRSPTVRLSRSTRNTCAHIRTIDSLHAKQRALLMATYATGLRVSAVVHRQRPDIASECRLIRVNQGKGGQDRSLLLSPRRLAELCADGTLGLLPRKSLRRISIGSITKRGDGKKPCGGPARETNAHR